MVAIFISGQPKLCLGCKICMLTCSWQLTKEFQPLSGAINVEIDEKNQNCWIFFKQDKCTACKLCLKNCPTGALKEIKGEEIKEAE